MVNKKAGFIEDASDALGDFARKGIQTTSAVAGAGAGATGGGMLGASGGAGLGKLLSKNRLGPALALSILGAGAGGLTGGLAGGSLGYELTASEPTIKDRIKNTLKRVLFLENNQNPTLRRIQELGAVTSAGAGATTGGIAGALAAKSIIPRLLPKKMPKVNKALISSPFALGAGLAGVLGGGMLGYRALDPDRSFGERFKEKLNTLTDYIR